MSGWRILIACLSVLIATTMCAGADKESSGWVEVRSPHFDVATNASEAQARQLALRFEQIRAVFHAAYPRARLDPGKPTRILAAANEPTFRALLPQYWEKPGQVHPTGLFIGAMDKYYVAIELGLAGPKPNAAAYHEYVHLLMNLNFHGLPLWLSEGIADFYANSEIAGQQAYLGQPDEGYLELLRHEPLLPLETLFAVGQDSPYYNEQSKVTMFYAESWALVHYLMLGDHSARRPQLEEYLRLVTTGAQPEQADARVFGNLAQVRQGLETYIAQKSLPTQVINVSIEKNVEDFPARQLSPAEAAALRGDFLVHTGQTEGGRASLEEALSLDPNLVTAREGMGMLLLETGHEDEAARWFAQAAALDSQNYLAHYYAAMVRIHAQEDAESLAQAEKSLRRAIQLNDQFAPAYDALASLYAAKNTRLDEALALARKAAELEPNVLAHQLNAGHILMQMGKADDAVALAQRIQAAAQSPQDRTAAAAFLTQARQYQANRLEAQLRRTESPSKLPADKSAAAQSEGAVAAPMQQKGSSRRPSTAGSYQHHSSTRQNPPAQGKDAEAEGAIAEVNCRGIVLDMQLQSGTDTYRLHTDNYLQVQFLSLGWRAPGSFNPCRDIVHLHARVLYREVQGRPRSGEISAIVLRE